MPISESALALRKLPLRKSVRHRGNAELPSEIIADLRFDRIKLPSVLVKTEGVAGRPFVMKFAADGPESLRRQMPASQRGINVSDRKGE